MPHKAPKPCAYPGCPELVNARYCERHEKQETQRYEKNRPSSAQRGYSYRWQNYAKQYLAEHPLCINFDECHNVAKLVDHIEPHRHDVELFWDPGNHQAMCKPCHDKKTAKEDGGFGNPRREGG